MRAIVVSFLLGFIFLAAYPQSKLQGAGKASKVGGTTTTPKKPTTPKPSQGKKPVSNQTTPQKGSADSKYEVSAYMEVAGVKFGNADDNGHVIDKYGAKLYASEVKYLKPQLSYKGLASSEKKVTVYVKILNEDGSLKKGSNSPEGYTYKQEITVQPGSNQTVLLLGWGNNSGGSFSPGQYTFEIWYKDKLIFQDGTRLYSGSTPLVSSNILKINKIAFGSEDADNNINIKIGETLFEGEVKYLIGNMYYEGLYSNEQKVTLYIRMFLPSGSLDSGSSSPAGFTYKRDVTIKPGSNVYKITGWGNKNGTSYKEGKHKYEIWLDGEKIYETTFNVTKKAQSSYDNKSGVISGHDYVDLGLPSGTKWATCNVGASSIEEKGNLYAWGEVSPKKLFSVSNYFDSSYNKYTIKTKTSIVGTTNDVAYIEWGEEWRMPTRIQVNELVNNCEWKAGNYNGRKGMIGKGPNGKTIFFPATGYGNENDIWYTDDEGTYLCGELCNPDKHNHNGYDPAVIVDAENSKRAYCYSFSYRYGQPTRINSGCAQRYYGRAIRPVKK